MNIWPQGGHIFSKNGGHTAAVSVSGTIYRTLCFGLLVCRATLLYHIPPARATPSACGRQRAAPVLSGPYCACARARHAGPSAASVRPCFFLCLRSSSGRRPFHTAHAVPAPAMRGRPPHPSGPASLFACVHQAGGAHSIRLLFHMQPAPAGRTRARERASRHRPAPQAAPTKPALFVSCDTDTVPCVW